MNLESKIFLAGHRGMVGAAIGRALRTRGYGNLVTRTHAELDLVDQSAVRAFFAEQRPDLVILAAAKVGGIQANNSFPADFIYQNLMIEANVVEAAWRNGVERLLLLGSSCIYPREVAQPMAESALLTGTLEPTNEAYAIAKIAGIKLCESFNRQHGTDFRSVMPTNLYGPGDNFHPTNSHVIPALLRRFHEARLEQRPVVEVWGSGRPRREFLHVDDMATACVHVLELDAERYRAVTDPMLSHLNVGTGEEVSIADLARGIAGVVGYGGEIRFDASKPDGTPRKLMDPSRIHALGWRAHIGLNEGLKGTYEWFLEHQEDFRR